MGGGARFRQRNAWVITCFALPCFFSSRVGTLLPVLLNCSETSRGRAEGFARNRPRERERKKRERDEA